MLARMSLYDALKTVHVLAIATWFGAAALQLLLMIRVRGGGGDRQAFMDDMEFAGARLFPAASAIAGLTGIAMVLDADYIGFGEEWIVLAIVGWLAASVTGAVFIEGAVRKADLQGVYRFALVHMAIVVLVVVDMVVKPG
jgi:uncharacterized membrane protein